MKTIYLPQLNSIKIENYSLYYQQPTFNFAFSSGISCIMGGNGIGKTTFVEIIIYCLLGSRSAYSSDGTKRQKPKHRIESLEFFKVRMNERHANNDLAKATLTFGINNTEIIITRSLYEDRIIYLKVGNIEYSNPDEQSYDDAICKLTLLSSFQLFDIIVRQFLFFDELRTNIAWEAKAQDQILRILFFDEDVYAQFRELQKSVVTLDTEGRHLSEDRRVIMESLYEMKNDRNKLCEEVRGSDVQYDNYTDILNIKYKLEQEQLELKTSLDESLLDLANLEEIYNRLYGENSQVLMKMERLDSGISKMEAKLFKGIYNCLPDFYLPLERAMLNDGKCIACGAHIKELRQRASTYKQEGRCLLCSSKFNISEMVDQKSLIKKLNDLYSTKSDLINIIENKKIDIQNAGESVAQTSQRIAAVRDILEGKNREIVYINSLLAEQSKEITDTYTEIMKEKDATIRQLDVEIEKKYRERDEAKRQLNDLHKRFSDIVDNLNNNLSMFFNKYASTFIGLTCELTVSQGKTREIPHVSYMPKIDGKVRQDIWSVSESQRFFLDQAFRMAIIDYLQGVIPCFKTFFITETPEGSLDISYEGKVAEMFLLFAKSSNNIIFTSNLNSSNFLMRIYESFESQERLDRTLNLFSKGNQTEVQLNNPDLKRIIDKLLGGGSNG